MSKQPPPAPTASTVGPCPTIIQIVGFGWLVGCFGFNGPLRQYFSLYRAVSQREGERGEKGQMREKMSKQPPPAPTASATGPCPTIIQISRTPRHWKFTQHLRTTRPPPPNCRTPRHWKFTQYHRTTRPPPAQHFIIRMETSGMIAQHGGMVLMADYLFPVPVIAPHCVRQ